MYQPSKARSIGILTSGGDCPGLNAAIRGVAKGAMETYGIEVFGILDGFTGLVESRFIPLTDRELTGLLTLGGTILGTSRNKPHKMPGPDGKTRDMTGACVENYRRMRLDCLVCIGGDGTAKNALRLKKAGLNVINLPKTIDNDIAETDMTFGFDSAMMIVTEAIDRLHTTASSHQRIILVDIMGHNAGWLALASSLASGADVCLIPEIPYRIDNIVSAIEERRSKGRRFSLISVAEGAHPLGSLNRKRPKDDAESKAARDLKDPKDKPPRETVEKIQPHLGSAELAAILEKRLGMETRVTTLGHIQRGGIPSATDRLLATQLGITAARLIAEGTYGVMVALRGNRLVPVPLEKVASRRKTIPLNDPMIETARMIGLCLGD